MPAISFGAGGPAAALDFTLWYGLTPTAQGYFPAVAYHPSLLGNTVEREANRLIRQYGRTDGMEGTPLPSAAPPSARYSNIKLWGRFSRMGLHLSLCKCHPVDPDIISFEIISGFVDSDHTYFRQFTREVENHRGLLLTLLDDDLNPCFDMLNMLVERYGLTGGW